MKFFDYTSLDDIVPHGLTAFEKLLPIVILFTVFFLIFRYHGQIRSYKHENKVRIVLGVMMLIGELSYMIWNYVHSLNGDVRFITTLPFQLCSYSIWGLAYVMFTKNKTVYNYLFIFGIAGIAALIFPNLNHGFNSFRYYQLFYSHSLLMIALYYFYKVHDFYPKKKDLIKSFILLNILIVVSVIVNVILNTDFLYLGPGNKPIDWAWDWPWTLIEYEALMGLLYFLFYLGFKKVKKDEYSQ